MEWNLKTPSWDLTQFVQETIPNIGSDSGSGSSFGFKGDFSVDLKLGQVNDYSSNENSSVSKMALSPSLGGSSSKRARAINNGGVHIVSCLVDGCTADLSNCRDYHRRHKVCELHSKTPQVTINGHSKRFCQQCSRFHSLEEFDEGKRSCRKRLDGHNRRRRKPQPQPLSRAGSFLSTNQGTRYLAFSSPQVYPTTTMANPIWAGATKSNNDTKLYNYHSNSHLQDKQYPYQESSSPDRGDKQFSFLHSTNLELSSQSARETFVCQPLLKTPPESASSSGGKMLCDGFPNRIVNSDCALSLLSSSPTRSSSMGLSHQVQPGLIHATHVLTPGLSYSGVQHMGSVLVPNAGDAEDQRMFHMVPHAPQDVSETPFYWD